MCRPSINDSVTCLVHIHTKRKDRLTQLRSNEVQESEAVGVPARINTSMHKSGLLHFDSNLIMITDNLICCHSSIKVGIRVLLGSASNITMSKASQC